MRTRKVQKRLAVKPSWGQRAPEIVIASMLGALGAAIMTGIFAAPQKFYEWVTRPPEFPPQAVVLSVAADCGAGYWEKVPGVDGRFLVGAVVGQKAGEQTPGRTKVKLKVENIPSMGITVGAVVKKGELGWGSNTTLLTELVGGEKQEVARIGRYNNEEVDIAPPGFALTVCKRKG